MDEGGAAIARAGMLGLQCMLWGPGAGAGWSCGCVVECRGVCTPCAIVHRGLHSGEGEGSTRVG